MKTLALAFVAAIWIGSCEEVFEKDQMGLPKEITLDSNGEQSVAKCEYPLHTVEILNEDDENVYPSGLLDRGDTLQCRYKWLTIEIYPENPSELFITAEPNFENKKRSLRVNAWHTNDRARIKIIQNAKRQTTDQIYLIKEEH